MSSGTGGVERGTGPAGNLWSGANRALVTANAVSVPEEQDSPRADTPLCCLNGMALDDMAVNRTEVKEVLLRRINDFRLTQFETYRLRPTDAPVAAAPNAAPSQVQLDLNPVGS